MLTKIVDGKELICSEEEERVIRMKWELNDKYPEYVGHLMFDGVTEPKHDMVECRKTHKKLHDAKVDEQIAEINRQIEIAQEEGFETSLYFNIRKHLRKLKEMTFDHCETVEHLKQSIIDVLKEVLK